MNKEEKRIYDKIYRQNNKQKIDDYHKKWYEKNKEKILERTKIYQDRPEVKEKIKERVKIWRKSHKKELNKYLKNKRKIDINYNILCNLRTRIRLALKNNWKSGHTIELLGCSIEQLKQHLEAQFKEGMSWDNYGRGWGGKGMQQWHIDHIKSLVSFDRSDTNWQFKAFHYTNLQPLWAKENLSKGSKI